MALKVRADGTAFNGQRQIPSCNMAAMAWLRTLVDICFFRSGPQALPASVVLAGLTAAAYLATGMWFLSVIEPGGNALGPALADTILSSGVLYLALQRRGLTLRYPQSLTAIMGAWSLINLVSVPLAMPLATAAVGLPRVLETLGLFVSILWSVAVAGFILRHALSITLVAGQLIAFGYALAEVWLLGALFPAAQG